MPTRPDTDIAPTDGWGSPHDCRIGIRKGALVVRAAGEDPYVVHRLQRPADGPCVLTLRARTRTAGTGQVFWAENGADFAAERAADWRVAPDGRWHEATIPLPARRIAALRLDPFTGPGEIEIDRIVLTDAAGRAVRAWTFDRLPESDPGPAPREEWRHLDNGRIRIGVKVGSGAAIGWLSQGAKGRNLLNHFDKGRLIQQSYYGDEDGSVWGKQPWRWNPVQGGDYKGNPAKVLELKTGRTEIFARTMGRNWAGCTDLPEAIFEERIRLLGDIAHVRYRFAYSGKTAHALRDQEIPAVFVEPDLDTLVLYDGAAPWTDGPLHRSKPGWPNEGRRPTEHWAAYVGADGIGVGALVPAADTLTCYRFGDGKAEHGACSYFAPLARFAIVPGTVFAYDLYLTIGTVDQIRRRFRDIAAKKAP